MLTGLKELDLCEPADVAPGGDGLRGLKELWLGANQLDSLPEERSMTGLEGADLSRNQLTSLPEEIGLMTGLKELDLDENQLTSLPEEIVALTGLTSLRSPQQPARQTAIARHRGVDRGVEGERVRRVRCRCYELWSRCLDQERASSDTRVCGRSWI